MRRIWLALLLVLSVGFSVPSVALADDGLIDSFSGGLQTLVSPESVKVEETASTPESVYVDSYEPVLVEELVRSEEIQELDGMGGIRQVVNQANRVGWGTNNITLRSAASLFLGSASNGSSLDMRNMFLLPAVGICFMWWGVRKVVRMIKSAWYKGHASV